MSAREDNPLEDDSDAGAGPCVFECQRIESRASQEFSRWFLSVPAGLVLAALCGAAGAIGRSVLTHGPPDALLFFLIGGCTAPFTVAFVYRLIARHESRVQFCLDDTVLRYWKQYWNTDEIVAIRDGDSLGRTDQNSPGSTDRSPAIGIRAQAHAVAALLSEGTIYLELRDGTKDDLIKARQLFRANDIAALCSMLMKRHPHISVDSSLLSENSAVSQDTL